MKKIFTIIVAMAVSLQAFSQIEISGRVTDGDTGESLPMATVSIEGTSLGTIADLDGNFTITANSDTDILVCSFVGYLSKSISIGNQRVINVSLFPDLAEIDEVVVTALGIKRSKKALGYAVQDVKGDEISETNPSNVVSALSGRIAGAHVVTSSGQVGASSTIQIRGNKSLSGSAQPLFVVDGTPIMNGISSARSSTSSTDFGNAAMDIDPSNVESISILKGPSASALYGSRAANGVILITTKKGAGQKGLGVEFSSSLIFDNVYLLPNYQNEYGQGLEGSEFLYKKWESSPRNRGKSYQEFTDARGFQWGTEPGQGRMMDADESWGVRLGAGLLVAQMDSPIDPETGNIIKTDWKANPDNVKDFYETGITSVNNLSLTKGGEMGHSRFTMGYSKQKGTSPNTDQRKMNLGINSGIKLSDKLSVDVNVNYVNLKNDNLPQTGNSMRNPLLEYNAWFGRQVNTKYLKDHYDEIIDYKGNLTAFNWMMGYGSQHPNPYWNAYKNTMSRDRNRIYGNAAINYELFEGIELMARVGTDFFTENRRFIYHKYSRDWTPMYTDATNGNLWEQYRIESETNADLLLKINKNISDDITLFSTIGGNYRKAFDQYATTSGTNLVIADFFSTSNFEGEPNVDFTKYTKVTNSVFGSANMGFRNYLFMDLTLRGDWSSTLPSENWNYWYPSVNLGFIFTEALGIASDAITYGKLRAGYAIVGDDTSPYSLSPVFYSQGTTFNNGTSANGINMFGVQSTLPSVDLLPEMTYSTEIGGEFRFLKSRLGLDITYYNATTKNQLINVDIPYSSGYSGWMKNAGSINNSGIELQINGTVIKSDNGFNWKALLNWSTNRNEVVELADNLEELHITTYMSLNSNTSLMAFPGKEWGAIYGTNYQKNEDGKIIVSSSGRPLSTPKPVILGYVNPDWIGGIANTFSYKGLSLNVLVDFRKGGDVFSYTKAIGQKTGILQCTVEDGIRENGIVVDGVYEDGTENTSVISAQDFWSASRNWGELSIVDGSFIKLREVVLSYNIPSSITDKLKLQSAMFSLFGRNLALLYTDKSNDVHIDPEVSTGGSTGGIGLEQYQLAPSRSLGLKLNIKF